MGVFEGIVLYLIVWWLSLFAVLPWGVRPMAKPDAVSGWRGAPADPRLWRTVIVTTLVALVLWFGIHAIVTSPYLSFRQGWLAVQPHD